jgi:hypothetical protein
MRARFVAGVIAFFCVVSLILSIVYLGPSLLERNFGLHLGSAANTTSMETPVSGGTTVIARENARPGSSNWHIPGGREAKNHLQAYASATSVAPGMPLTFYVSTLQTGTRYWIEIYRMGWYGGLGARLVETIEEQRGLAQGYYDATAHRLVDCKSCLVDMQTGLIDARWKPSTTLNVPADWTTGLYLAKLIDAGGWQTYVPFTVTSTRRSAYVAVTPDTTYAAYNDWGGSSLYTLTNSIFSKARLDAKATKVSFNRPYVQENGATQVISFEMNAIRWMERQGYDLSYLSIVDIQRNPALLLQYQSYISLGHDEYWSQEIRNGVEQARDKGIGLAFLGANAGYWQIRFEADSNGNANRTIVCYKVETIKNDLERDPLFGKENARVTARWRDEVVSRPENALVGVMFSDVTQKKRGVPWVVDRKAKSPLLEGTGLQPGQEYGCGLVGYEWDRVFSNGSTPAGLKIIGTSPIINDENRADIGQTAYYIASSGAFVFATGSIYWTYALDSYRPYVDTACGDRDVVVPGMQKLMANVMAALVVRHAPNSL